MYENPVLFPQISNRESWIQIIQIADDDTGDLIALTDNNGVPLYAITLEISRTRMPDYSIGYGTNPYYDWGFDPIISATLADYISIVDVGTFQIALPKSKMQQLHGRTYDVFLTIDPINADDGRQLLIGRLPVFYGGRNT
jgi:hypothetical protein